MTPLLAAAINWHSFFFLLFALVSCGMALSVLFSKNIVRMAFFLTISLGAVAGLFILAGAHFVGAMQLMIYVGGTLVLLIFGVMLTAQAQFIEMKTRAGEWVMAAIVGASLLSVLLAAAFSVDDWRGPSSAHLEEVAGVEPARDTTALGAGLVGLRVDSLEQGDEQLREGMAGYFLPFEIVSVHLLVVLIGAAFLARSKHVVAGAGPGRVVSRDRRRPLVPSVLLGVLVAGHLVCAAVCFLAPLETKESLPGMGGVAAWLWSALGVCCGVDALLVLVVLGWQKWGVLALGAMALFEVVLLNYAGAPVWVTLGTLVLAAVGVALVFAIAKMGGSRSLWSQSE